MIALATPEQLVEARDVLRAAAEAIEAGGHCKNKYQDGASRCAAGAIYDSGGWGNKPASFRAEELLRDRLRAHGIAPYIALWNDAPERTGAEVVAMMREAADGGAS